MSKDTVSFRISLPSVWELILVVDKSAPSHQATFPPRSHHVHKKATGRNKDLHNAAGTQ